MNVGHAAGFLESGSEMGALIRAKDWSSTPIGPVESWSPSLRMMVGLLLANRFPLLLWWGPNYVSIYNDAYRPVLGEKHPRSLGEPVKECWSEIWHILKPLIDAPFEGGPSTWMDGRSSPGIESTRLHRGSPFHRCLQSRSGRHGATRHWRGAGDGP
jgi:hypothetical protein